MPKWDFYTSSMLPTLGGLDYPTKFTNLMAAIQTYFESRQHHLTGCWDDPTLAIAGTQVTITDLLAVVAGYAVNEDGFVDLAGSPAGTYYIQVDGDCAFTATAAEDPTLLTLATVAWSGAALSALTEIWPDLRLGVFGPSIATDGYFAQFDGPSGRILKSVIGLVTSIGNPGSDTKIPTEQAVREALTAIADHGGLSGLADDDHTQYLLASGARALAGNLSAGSNTITDLKGPTNANDAARKADVDAAILGLDWQQSVLDKDLTAPPGSPATGARYIVAATATGAWAGKEKTIAEWNGAAWVFTTPNAGMACWVEDENKQYTYYSSTWTAFAAGVSDHGALSGLADDDHTQYALASGARAFSGGITGVSMLLEQIADALILTLKTAAGVADENDALKLVNTANAVQARLYNNGTFKGRYLWSIANNGTNGGGFILQDTATGYQWYLVQRVADDGNFHIYSSDGGATPTYRGPMFIIDRDTGTVRIPRLTDSTPTNDLLQFLNAARDTTLSYVDKDGIWQGKVGAGAVSGLTETTDAPVGASDWLPVLVGGTDLKKIKLDTLAKGKRTFFLSARSGEPLKTGGCAISDTWETTTNKLVFVTLDFDKDTDEAAEWHGFLPDDYDGGTVIARPLWTAASGSGTVCWTLAGRAFANDAALDQAMGTAQSSTDTLTATVDYDEGPATSAITLAGSPAAGQYVVFRGTRDVSEDSLDADARLIGWIVEYGVNKWSQ